MQSRRELFDQLTFLRRRLNLASVLCFACRVLLPLSVVLVMALPGLWARMYGGLTLFGALLVAGVCSLVFVRKPDLRDIRRTAIHADDVLGLPGQMLAVVSLPQDHLFSGDILLCAYQNRMLLGKIRAGFFSSAAKTLAVILLLLFAEILAWSSLRDHSQDAAGGLVRAQGELRLQALDPEQDLTGALDLSDPHQLEQLAQRLNMTVGQLQAYLAQLQQPQAAELTTRSQGGDSAQAGGDASSANGGNRFVYSPESAQARLGVREGEGVSLAGVPLEYRRGVADYIKAAEALYRRQLNEKADTENTGGR